MPDNDLEEREELVQCEDCGATLQTYWDGMNPILCFACWKERDK